MWFRVLGPLELQGSIGVSTIAAQRQQIVLMMMLVEANRVVPIDRLIEAVWDESPPATAKGQIQICVSMLRKVLADIGIPDVIGTTSAGYIVQVPEQELDLQVFGGLARSARKAASEGRLDEADAGYRRALELWRGTTLTTGNSRVLQAVELHLTEQRLSVVEEWADVRLALGLHNELVGDLMEHVAAVPLREGMRAKLMLALYRAGRQAEALEVFRAGRALLIDELGLEPGEELRRLESDILTGALDLEPPSGTSVMAEPVTTAKAVPAQSAEPVVPRMLPGDVSDFTGHIEVRQQIRKALCPPAPTAAAPIVTVSGKAGVGKSTIAVHMGHRLAAEFPDGQLFVKLNGLSAQPVTAAQALERFLRGLGLRGDSVPEGLEERAEVYRQLVADRKILVVLDDAADEEQVRWLVPGSPSCSVIVTSRCRLAGLPGLVGVEVDMLDTEHAMELLATVIGPARVYAELNKSLELVAFCGGLPLALRIGAARLAARPHWTVGQFVDRLDNEQQRLDELVHRGVGVRANLALTYEILSEPARRLFRRLGVLDSTDFPGWMAAPLLGIAASRAEEVLEELVDARFVDVERAVQGPCVRYKLHDLIRAYARERLVHEETIGERSAALSRTLGAWLFITAEAHRREYGGDYTLMHGDFERWPLPPRVVDRELVDPIEWYERERFGIISAVRQAAGAGQHEACWDLALTSVTLFEARSYYDDWRITHEIALAEARRAGNRRGEAAMLLSLGSLRLSEQRYDDAAARLTAANQIFGEIGELHGQALGLRNLAFLARMRGRLDEAERHCRQALNGFREVGDRIGEAHTLSGYAQIHIEWANWDEAQSLLDQAVHLVAETGNRRVHAQVLCRLGDLQLARADHEAAEEIFHQVITMVQSYGDQVGEVYALHGLGVALARQGRFRDVEVHLVRALGQTTFLGHRLLGGHVRLTLGEVYLKDGNLERALEVLAQAAQMFGELDIKAGRARTLCALGDVHARLGQVDAGRFAWGQALQLITSSEPALGTGLAAELRERLGDNDARIAIAPLSPRFVAIDSQR